MSEGFTLWFTGLSGAGKSTLANLVADELRRRGYRVEVLDGDEVRTNLSKGLGFSKEDRDTNIRRIGYVCQSARAQRRDRDLGGDLALPRRARRGARAARALLRGLRRCPIDTLVERDVKGLYKKALAGEIKSFHRRLRSLRAAAQAELTIDYQHAKLREQSLDRLLGGLEAAQLYQPPGSAR